MTGKASHKEKSLLRNLLKFLGVLLVSILLLTGLGWYILQDNNPIVLRFLRQMAQDKWNANLRLDGYHLEWENGLADLKVEVEGLRLSNYKKIEDPFLKITKAETFIHPWSFITNNSGIEKIEPIKADSIWIYLLKDSSDVSNFRFNNRSRKSNKKHSASASIFSRLPSLEATFLDFYFDNQFKNKWQRAQLSPMQFVTAQDVEKEWYATFKGDTHFDALVFNEKDGGFLEDVSGLLELELKHFWQQDSLRLTDGFLEVAENKYLLKGDFVRAAPDHIQLEISQPTAILSEVLPLLSNTIKTNLKNVVVDQPIAAVFTMDKLMQVGQRAVVRLDFETRGAKLKFEQLKMSAADLSGFYSNDCDKDGEGSPEEACLVIDKLNGEFMGIIPAELIGKITELKDPKLQATGSLDMSLPRLNELLSSSQKATFQDGEATLNFFYSGRFEDIIKTPFDESKVNMNGVAQFNNVVLDVKNRDELFPALTGQLTFDDKWTTLQDLSLDWLGTELNVTGYMNNLPEFLLYGNEAMETDLNIHLNHLRADKLIPKGSNQTKVKSKVGANWEYEKWKKNLTSLATNINGVIHLKIDTLSYDTLFFTEVATQTRLYTPRQAAYQDSSMIRIDELSAKFMGAAPLFVNFIFPQDTVQEVIFDIEIPSVPLYVNELLAKEARIVNGAMDLQLRASTPLQAMLDPKQFLTELRYDGVINMDEVDADLSRATWPVKKLSGTFDFDSDELYFDDITFDYERSPFSLNGTVTDYAFFRKGMEQKAIVDLQIKGSHLNRRNDELEAAANAVANNQEVTNPSPIKLFHSLDTIYHYA
ncbi:MAG: hypothetical protein AB8F74_09070, partial [Saprospiraceae bacterium]